MDTITALVGHLAWPLTALLLGIMVLKELKGGLISALMPNGGSIEAAGFKLQTNAAKQAARKANVAVVDEPKAESDKDLSPYEQVMDAWRELATALTAKAVELGGADDNRKIYLNIEILREKGVYDTDVLSSVRDLFQARNSARKLGADSLAEADAESFVQTAKALTQIFI
ncbi:hypothetical protein GFL49_34820 [Rhizobium leguminosarum bv. viciae]|uniref:hypothetical protein n=1 Tax=Rhizobium leguminosarum TaxID=384 RepID=UPI0010317541|nr:hypothetical protein [Rhizobium leguminosarum]NKL38782.1 hypothetical protein [Rhizobium leguminosarum bv. viciae]TBF40462.1 hypothetical protein ELG92_10510 [Rhizobium leguminosarum]